jgi:uncharacterized membrane protein YkvA (DUF1232 family)
MRILIELDREDVARFEAALKRASDCARTAEESDILDAARHALQDVPIASAPRYVRERVAQVQVLIDMLEDEAWALHGEDRLEVLRALAYFSDPEDLIPDHIGGIGLLDDVIVLELLLRRERHLLEAYQDFCRFRAAKGPPPADRDGRIAHAAAIARRRQQLRERMRRRARAAPA